MASLLLKAGPLVRPGTDIVGTPLAVGLSRSIYVTDEDENCHIFFLTLSLTGGLRGDDSSKNRKLGDWSYRLAV